MNNETGDENKPQIDVLSIFDSEPCILLAGENFDVLAEKNQRIINLPWSCVFTSSNDINYATKFTNQNRKPRDIFDIKFINEKALDKKNLKIVRLFGSSDVGDRTSQVEAYKLLTKIEEIFQSYGKLFLVGFDKDEKLESGRLCDVLTRLRKKSVIIFDENNYLTGTEVYEISKKNAFMWFEDGLDNYLSAEIEDSQNEYEEFDEYQVQVYLNKKISSIENDDIFELSLFATLLNIHELNDSHIPSYLLENYFYTFLKESAYFPQWYGYENGFNLVRKFEDDLYKKITRSLETPGNLKQQPICLYGQSGSGKSIAIGNLAYKIFNDKKFPVIFMNNKNLTFSNDIYSKNGESKPIKSRHFESLTYVIEMLEKKGAESVLIIWDLSAATKRDVEKVTRLYEKLRNRGRNIQILFTSYELLEEKNEEFSVPYDKIQATVKLTETEKKDGKFFKNFETLLKKKAIMTERNILHIVNEIFLKEDFNVMSTLYLTFFDVRKPMQIGIKNEAVSTIQEILNSLKNGDSFFSKTSIQLAFEKAFGKEWLLNDESNKIRNNESIEKLLIIVCICTKYNLSLSIDFAYRLINSFDFEVIKKIFNISFFGFNENSFKIRTRLEAEILLKSYQITLEKEVEYVCDMISNINASHSYGHDSESNLINQLLVLMGPNSKQFARKEDMYQYYPRIISALSQLRENSGGCTKLTLQEIVYIREYYTFDKTTSNDIISNNIISNLQQAIDIGKREIHQCEKYDNNFKLLSALIIEVSNTKLYLHDYSGNNNIKELNRIHRDIKNIIVANPEDSYAYNLLLRVSLHEYNLSLNESDKFEILSEMCEIIDTVRSEHQPIATTHYFYEPAEKFYEELNNSRVDEYFDELIKNNSYAGIFVKVRQILAKSSIDIYKKKSDEISDEISDEKLDICKMLCEKYLENPEYTHITDASYQCQQLLLRIKWLIFNRQTIFSTSDPQFTTMNRDEWMELKEICEKCKTNFFDENSIDFYSANTFLYVLALSYVQLDDFKNAYEIISIIKQKTEYWQFDNRIRARHIICDEKGTPKTFEGRFERNTDPTEDRGHVEIFKIRKEYNFGKYGVHYHKRNMKSITIRKSGQNYSDFQLGLGFMGFGVYRGLGAKDGERNG